MNLSSTVKTPSAMELRIIFISAEVRSFSDFMLNPLTQSFCTLQISYPSPVHFATYLLLQAPTTNRNLMLN